MINAQTRAAAPVLVDQDEALTRYLDALFQAPTLTEAAPEAAPELPPASAPAAAVPPAIGPGEYLNVSHAGLRLALPLAHLAAILKAPDHYVRLPHQAEWTLGVSNHRGHNVLVVSAAELGGIAAAAAETPASAEAQLILLGDGRWGLHVDQLHESRHLEAADLHLRGRRERTPWIAGYVQAGLASIVDVPALIAALDARLSGTDAASTHSSPKQTSIP
jgi:chemotaxis signal transduction protein